jgi:hypothetical protein
VSMRVKNMSNPGQGKKWWSAAKIFSIILAFGNLSAAYCAESLRLREFIHTFLKASKSPIKAPINSFQNFTTHGGPFPETKS